MDLSASASTSSCSLAPTSQCSPTDVEMLLSPPSSSSPPAKTEAFSPPSVAEKKTTGGRVITRSKKATDSRQSLGRLLQRCYDGEVSARELKAPQNCRFSVQYLHPDYISDASLTRLGMGPHDVQDFRSGKSSKILLNTGSLKQFFYMRMHGRRGESPLRLSPNAPLLSSSRLLRRLLLGMTHLLPRPTLRLRRSRHLPRYQHYRLLAFQPPLRLLPPRAQAQSPPSPPRSPLWQ